MNQIKRTDVVGGVELTLMEDKRPFNGYSGGEGTYVQSPTMTESFEGKVPLAALIEWEVLFNLLHRTGTLTVTLPVFRRHCQ